MPSAAGIPGRGLQLPSGSGARASPGPSPRAEGEAVAVPGGEGSAPAPGIPYLASGPATGPVRLALGPRGDLGSLPGPHGRPPSPAPPELTLWGPPSPLPGRGLAQFPRASALPPSPPVAPSIGQRSPARPSRGGAEGGARRPGVGAQAAREEGDSGEGGRGGGRTRGRPADRRTDAPAGGHADGAALARALRPQPWSGGCAHWSGWRGARPAVAPGSTASWICCWGCTTNSAAPPSGGSATWRSS